MGAKTSWLMLVVTPLCCFINIPPQSVSLETSYQWVIRAGIPARSRSQRKSWKRWTKWNSGEKEHTIMLLYIHIIYYIILYYIVYYIILYYIVYYIILYCILYYIILYCILYYIILYYIYIYIYIIIYIIIYVYNHIYIDPFLPWCHTSIKSGPVFCGQGCSLALGSRIRCIADQSSPPAKCYSAQRV